MSNVYRLPGRRDGMAQDQRALAMSLDAIAPWPAVDRWPNIIGSGLTLQYIGAVTRLCLTGYRQQYVDLAEELLSLDPHAFSVVQKRVLAIGQGKVEFVPPKGEDLPDEGERAIAKDVAAWVQSEINQIPDLIGAMTQLAWGLYYSVSAVEKMLVRRDDGSIGISALNFVHYRRLSYPDPWKWDLYIWDQGLVLGPGYGMAPTQGVYGLNVESVREKFVVHTPQVCGSYPTRDGLARELVYWMAIKHIASRYAPQYLERFAIPFADIEFSTKGSNPTAPDQPRSATKEDIGNATQAGRDLGAGALAQWVHPDSVRLVFGKPDGTPALKFEEWIELCDGQMSKATSGGTLTTEVTAKGGNRAVAQEQGKREEKLFEYDAGRMAATWKRDVGDFLVENNPRYAGLPKRLYPLCVVHVNDDPDPTDVIERAAKGAGAGLPVDADAVGRLTRLPLVENPKPTTPRRMIPIMPVKVTVPNDTLGLPDPSPPLPSPIPPGAAVPDPGGAPDDQPGPDDNASDKDEKPKE
jgi:phage gp29-like protein